MHHTNFVWVIFNKLTPWCLLWKLKSLELGRTRKYVKSGQWAAFLVTLYWSYSDLPTRKLTTCLCAHVGCATTTSEACRKELFLMSNIYRLLTWRLVSRSISLSLTWGTCALKRTGTWWKSWSEVRSVYEGRTLNWDMFTESITDTRRQEYYLCFYNKFELGVLLRVLLLLHVVSDVSRSIDGQLRPRSLSRHKSFILISAAFHWHHQTAAMFYSQFLPLTPRAGALTSYLREDLNTTELVCSLSDVVTRVTLGTLDSPHWTLTATAVCSGGDWSHITLLWSVLSLTWEQIS